ncbi:MAG: NYN domain-containing protein [Bacteroidales bacterium]|nr:NYN domain-containing protein [Bacteroidales bacterium]
MKKTDLLRIAMFYDGNYFLHVSNFYNHVHPKQARISINGLHQFIRHFLANEEEIDVNYCQIVEARYYRTRFSAKEIGPKGNQLFFDRLFDDILVSEGVIPFHFPIRTVQGVKMEKSIAVWLSLDAFDIAIQKRFDVFALVASDGDYLPLVRKLNSLGIKVLLASWEFEYIDDFGQQKMTKTSQDLIKEVTYPVFLNELIDDENNKDNVLINNIFVAKTDKKEYDNYEENLNSFEKNMIY